VADAEAGNVWLLHGEAGGGFGPAPSAAPGVAATSTALAVIDANGDSHPDLLVLAGSPGVLSVFVGDGDGGFSPSPSGASLATVATVVRFALGRLDDDAIDDLVSLRSDGAVHVALGSGTGTFTDVGLGDPARSFLGPEAAARVGGIHLALAELDGVPGTDLVIVDGPRATFGLLSGHGDGTFADALSRPLASSGRVLSIAPVVVNRGAAADLAVLSLRDPTPGTPSTVRVLRPDDGSFVTAPLDVGDARWLVARDLNGDGLSDLLLSDRDSRLIRTLHAPAR
jgi:hypothetical protein